MAGKRQLFAVLGGIGFVVAAALVPPFSHEPDLQLWHANLEGFVSEWWSLGPIGSNLLPVAAVVLGLLHLALGTTVRAGRMHLMIALPLLTVAAGLMLVDGTIPLLSLRFYLLKLLLFAWLATATLAYGWAAHGSVRTHTLVVAGLLALLYLASGWLAWPLMLFLLLVVILYWGVDSLLALRNTPEQALLTVLPWLGTIAVLLAVLLLERFSPHLHTTTRLLPQVGFLMLLVAPSFASFGSTIRSEAHMVDVLDRERHTSKKTISAQERRMTAERNETVRALKLEMKRIRDEAKATLEEAQKVADQVEPEPDTPYPVEIEPEKFPEVDLPDVNRDNLAERLEHLTDSLQRSRYAITSLKETLADLLGQVAVEEDRLATPFAEWENSLGELAEGIEILRTQFDLPSEFEERPSEMELPGGITVTGLETEDEEELPGSTPEPEGAFDEDDLAVLDPDLLEELPIVEEEAFDPDPEADEPTDGEEPTGDDDEKEPAG